MSVFFYEPFYDMERIFDAFNARDGSNNGQLQRASGNDVPKVMRPKMDLHENAEANTVTATFELPGLKKEDVQLDVHNGRLTISGESKTEVNQEEHGYAVRERRYGKFSRTLQLPEGVKAEEIKASMENGVLTVTFPKSTPEQAPKKISVS